MPKQVEEEIVKGRSMNEKEKKNNLESKRKTGSLSEVLGRIKSRRKVDEPKELTLAELKLESQKKKTTQNKENGRKEAQIREEKRQTMLLKDRDMEVMTVEDSDFYDFDEDRVEKSFKKGQIWAIYDDIDGFPRHYGLINDVVSLNPFEVKMSWLDLRNDRDEGPKSREKLGFHISCGRYEVGRNDTTDLLNIFSHMVECEREAKELYRIYPKKGSIWALYNEKESNKGKRSYDIVVCLTSYSEMYGLSLGYLKKVDGFRAVLERRGVGLHAIRWVEKDDFRLFSHQIPARKLSRDEIPNFSGDFWELDPASLPSDLLTVS